LKVGRFAGLKVAELKKRGRAPLFFVSVPFKGVTVSVSLLFVTLAGRTISVAAKGVSGAGWL
jgi:hypothetical protein